MNTSAFDPIDQALWHVGALLLNWGRLETDLTDSIVTMSPGATGPHVSPDNAARTLDALLNKWITVYSDSTAAQIAKAKALKEAIATASKDRNTICHGFSSVLDGENYHVGCWEMFHRHKMAGNFPPRRYYSRIELTGMCEQINGYSKDVKRLTQVAIDRPRKPRNRPAQ